MLRDSLRRLLPAATTSFLGGRAVRQEKKEGGGSVRHTDKMECSRLPTNRRQLPTNRRQLPTSRRQLRTSRCRLPTNRHRLSTNRCRLSTNRRHYPPTAVSYPPTAVSYHQPPSVTRQLPLVTRPRGASHNPCPSRGTKKNNLDPPGRPRWGDAPLHACQLSGHVRPAPFCIPLSDILANCGIVFTTTTAGHGSRGAGRL